VATTNPRPAWACPECCRETGCNPATRCRRRADYVARRSREQSSRGWGPPQRGQT